MNRRVQHLIWDWNGTLLDDVDACVAAINRMLERRGMPVVDRQSYREEFEFPVKNYYLTLGFDLEREDWNAMAREFHDYYAETSADSKLRPGVTPVLDGFLRAGVPMSVLSASELSILEGMMTTRGIRGCFGEVRGLDNLHATSKVGLGRELMAKLAMPADQVLLVGDTVHDFEVAEELGCRCVLVAGGHQAEHRLRRCGCPVVASLLELATHKSLGWAEGVCYSPPPFGGPDV